MHSYEVLSKEPAIILIDKFLDKSDCEKVLELHMQLEKSSKQLIK